MTEHEAEPTTEPASTPEPAPEPIAPEGEPEDDQADTADTEPEPAPEPEPAALSEKELERRFGSLEKEATRHANRVSEIVGEDAQELQPCPLCAGPFAGFIFPDAARMADDAQRAAVKAALGEDVQAELRVAEDKETCDKCDGWGRTQTGSKVPDQLALPCAKCKGYGWTYHGAPQTNGATPTLASVPDDRPPLEEDRPTDADPWGRTPDDPNYGRMPQYVRA